MKKNELQKLPKEIIAKREVRNRKAIELVEKMQDVPFSSEQMHEQTARLMRGKE